MGPPALSSGASQHVTSHLRCNKPAARLLWYRGSAAQRHRKPVRTQSSTTSTTLVPTDLLLHWVAAQDGASQPTVVIDGTASIAGRRLRATREQEPDDVLLSLPLSACFADLEVYSLSLISVLLAS